jgi:hypothetical protein
VVEQEEGPQRVFVRHAHCESALKRLITRVTQDGSH